MTKQLINQSFVDIAFDLGAKAYLDGEPMDSNPHTKETNPEAYAAWNQGWRFEKKYWEDKL